MNPAAAATALLQHTPFMVAQSMLDPAADQAQAIHSIWHLMLWVCVPLYVIVMIGVAVAIWRTRKVVSEPSAVTSEKRMSQALALWTTVIVGGLIVLTLGTFLVDRKLIPGAHADVNIRITGKQWWWQVEYLSDSPDQHFVTANELHIPVDKTTHIELASADVIHSFWVPNLSGKRDMIPGRVNEIDLTPRRVGTFRGTCAEFCGLQHAKMAMLVHVDDDAAFATWRAQQLQPRMEPIADEVKRGEAIFVSSACAMCHGVRGTAAGSSAGPDLTHFGSRDTLAAGTMPVNAGSVAAWLADPQQQKPGTNMPSVDLEPDDLNALVAYLLSLK